MGGMGGMSSMGMMRGMGMMGNSMMGMSGMGMMGGMCGKGGGAQGGKGDGKGKRSAVLGMCFGVIKSWNQEKGFGFVASPDLAAHGVDGDAYLHISQKGDHEVGSEVAFTLQLVNGRPQARSLKTPEEGRAEGAQSEALGQAEKEMMGQLQAGMGASAPGKGHDPREQVLGTWVGTIKSYNHEKKFGFLSCIELNAMSGVPGDVYLHDRVMTGFAVGNSVSFTACLRDGKLQGRDLQRVSDQVAKRMRLF
mmetsp:Transcript_105781/g.276239  ORF Transcript_105781/g.276239 Transcript_105781/m.276239 type:complete len:250 (+) Transcript_105781:1-750(+)